MTRADRINAVAAAAADDLNDESTVILSSATSSLRALEPGHPAREMLFDLQSAAQRCVEGVGPVEFHGPPRGASQRSDIRTIRKAACPCGGGN